MTNIFGNDIGSVIRQYFHNGDPMNYYSAEDLKISSINCTDLPTPYCTKCYLKKIDDKSIYCDKCDICYEIICQEHVKMLQINQKLDRMNEKMEEIVGIINNTPYIEHDRRHIKVDPKTIKNILDGFKLLENYNYFYEPEIKKEEK